MGLEVYRHLDDSIDGAERLETADQVARARILYDSDSPSGGREAYLMDNGDDPFDKFRHHLFSAMELADWGISEDCDTSMEEARLHLDLAEAYQEYATHLIEEEAANMDVVPSEEAPFTEISEEVLEEVERKMPETEEGAGAEASASGALAGS